MFEFLRFIAFEINVAYTLDDIGFMIGSFSEERALDGNAIHMAHSMVYHNEVQVRTVHGYLSYAVTLMGDGVSHYARMHGGGAM